LFRDGQKGACGGQGENSKKTKKKAKHWIDRNSNAQRFLKLKFGHGGEGDQAHLLMQRFCSGMVQIRGMWRAR